MNSCSFCNVVQDEKNVIYEDELAVVAMLQKPAVSGHLVVIPKAHYPILEEVPDNIAEHCFLVANRASAVLFDAFGAGGTNIIIQNGLSAGQTIPHFGIHVLPRKEDDGLSFKWQPKKITPQKIDEVAQALKDECDYIGQPVEEKKQETKKEEKNEKKIEYSEENYLLRQLRRVP